MAREIKPSLVVFVLLVVSILQHCCYGDPQVPCYFIFGDSLADSGNNNDLNTNAKVNYPPYGVDFPCGPTGRFCNGRTTVDLIAEALGFNNFIPPFARSQSTDTFQGVNYASGSAGIRDESGQHLGVRMNFNDQLKNHQSVVSCINSYVDLKKCLYSVGMGSNDYINNYFLPQDYPTSHIYNPYQYADVLIQQYSQQIRTLYNYGARKLALIGLGLIGCTPNAIASYGTNGFPCVNNMNQASEIFNIKLVSLVDQLNNDLSDAKFIYVNTSGMSLTPDSSSAGFMVTNSGCCPIDYYGQCAPNQTSCQDRTKYVFWDSFHPTEEANKIVARRSYIAGNPYDAYPMDISHLVQLYLPQS